MTRYEKLGQAEYGYVARKACGCVVGAVVDIQDASTAKSVASFIRDGLTVERVTITETRGMKWGCKCPREGSAQ